jgi:hypothetical protein
MGQTSKNCCPKCGVKFRTGALPTQDEVRRLAKAGIINLGEPDEHMDCPKCAVKLRVVSVRMGTFFTLA